MRKLLLGLFVGALLMVSVPVVADHIVEPTAPIIATRLALFEYNNRPATLLTCDGTEIVSFDVMRIELDVDAAARPSEHWNHIFTLTSFDANGKNDVVEWQTKPRHANIPPHEGGKLEGGAIRWEADEISQGLHGFAPGVKLRFDSRLMTLESGVIFDKSCTFTVG